MLRLLPKNQANAPAAAKHKAPGTKEASGPRLAPPLPKTLVCTMLRQGCGLSQEEAARHRAESLNGPFQAA